jgi:hypothetical protein
MEPLDDRELDRILRQWQAPGAPPSLNARVLGPRKRWWSFLLTGSIRLPVPAVLAIAAMLLIMAGALMRQRAVAPVDSSISLVDFRPVEDLNVRVIRNHDAN